MSLDVIVNDQLIERLIKKCKEELLAIISLKIKGDESKTKKSNIEKKNLKTFGDKLLKILADLLDEDPQGTQNNGAQSYSDTVDTQRENYEIIPSLFYNFLVFFFKNIGKFNQISENIDLDWIYDKFKVTNDNSRHFILSNETINLIESKLNDQKINPDWLIGVKIKNNFSIFRNSVDYEKLREVILLANYLKNRKIKTIKI